MIFFICLKFSIDLFYDRNKSVDIKCEDFSFDSLLRATISFSFLFFFRVWLYHEIALLERTYMSNDDII